MASFIEYVKFSFYAVNNLFIMNHEYNKNLNEVMKIVFDELQNKDFVIIEDYYFTVIKTNNMMVRFWDTNRWAAWFGQGKFEYKNDEGKTVSYEWDRERGSKWMHYRLAKLYLLLVKKRENSLEYKTSAEIKEN